DQETLLDTDSSLQGLLDELDDHLTPNEREMMFSSEAKDSVIDEQPVVEITETATDEQPAVETIETAT
ncbi:hypothetical protein, partial [Photobacterium leiognathi]|uniref:hypothetical protein n=1 Tax=Photobacterium leiognathi TaxID=553611 RepID=UPI002980BD2E